MTGYTPLAGFGLEPGDILIKKFYAKDPVSHGIQTGQALAGGKRYANYVHAAIALDGETVAEASGAGTIANELADNVAHGYKYKVFRFHDREIAAEAAEYAASQVHRNPKYSIKKAFKSLFKKKGKEVEAMGLLGEESQFCSEFTTACYNRVAMAHNVGPYIPLPAEAANPAELYAVLKSDPARWQALGDL